MSHMSSLSIIFTFFWVRFSLSWLDAHLCISNSNCLNKKNPESVIGVKAERSEKQSSQPLEFFPPPTLRSKGRSCPQTAPPAISTSLVLGLRVCVTTAWFCFFLRLAQSSVAQSGLELTEIVCFCLPSAESKGVCHHCLASSGLALHSDLQASFIC